MQDGLAIDAPSTIRPVLSVNFCKKYAEPEKSNDITDSQGWADSPSTLRPVLSVNFCKKFTEPEKSNDITYLIRTQQ
jgi:hypothetical protein